MENHCRILAWRIPRTDRACWTVVHGVTRVGDECVTNIFFQWIKDCSWMKLEHLLFARAQIARLQELCLSLDIEEKNRGVGTWDRTRDR